MGAQFVTEIFERNFYKYFVYTGRPRRNVPNFGGGGVPYVKLYQYNPKHLCPNLNGYGDNGQRSFKL